MKSGERGSKLITDKSKLSLSDEDLSRGRETPTTTPAKRLHNRGSHWWNDILKPLLISAGVFFALMVVVVWISRNIIARLLLSAMGLLGVLVVVERLDRWRRVSE